MVFEDGGAPGAANGNLVNGNTYYVIKSASNPDELSLAASATDAQSGNALGLGTITGTGNYLSDGAVLSQRAAWSQSQLQNSFSASILQPHTLTSTLYGTATDITGRNIYLSLVGAASA